jgi:hypothetical protein
MIFSGHETFHIREGWLHKGLTAVKKDPLIFSNPNATDRLGVGKNMVFSIRYWLLAAGLITEEKKKIGTEVRTKTSLSPLGEIIAKKDPYFEEDLTLWVIHYHLATNIDKATTWYWFFNVFPMRTFDAQSFVANLNRWVAEASKKQIAMPSLQKDLNCLLRTYSRARAKGRKTSPEDSLECPLSNLRLITEQENSGGYRVEFGKSKINPLAFGYALMSFLENKTDKTAKITEVANEARSPGRVFLMSEDMLVENLQTLEDMFGKRTISYVKTAGLNTVKASKSVSAIEFLEAAYEK